MGAEQAGGDIFHVGVRLNLGEEALVAARKDEIDEVRVNLVPEYAAYYAVN